MPAWYASLLVSRRIPACQSQAESKRSAWTGASSLSSVQSEPLLVSGTDVSTCNRLGSDALAPIVGPWRIAPGIEAPRPIMPSTRAVSIVHSAQSMLEENGTSMTHRDSGKCRASLRWDTKATAYTWRAPRVVPLKRPRMANRGKEPCKPRVDIHMSTR